MAGGAEVAALAAEGDQELRPALLAPNPGEARFEQATVKELLDDLAHHGPPGAVAVLEALLIDAGQLFEVILEEAVERRGLGTAGRCLPGSRSRADRCRPRGLVGRCRRVMRPRPGDGITISARGARLRGGGARGSAVDPDCQRGARK